MKTKLISLCFLAILVSLPQTVWGQTTRMAFTQDGGPYVDSPQAGNTDFLPLVLGGSGSGGGGGGGGGGGIHVVYAIYIGTDEQGPKPATYAHCAAHCGEKANWTFTHIGDEVQDARIALTPNGKPRIILFGPVYDPNWPRMRYQYAACDSGCTDSIHWTVTTIATPIEPTGTREYDNNHYFAIDKQGLPAFVYTDTTENNHQGTFLMSCQTNCTDVSHWIETVLSDALFDKVSLGFSPTGQPRLAFGFFDANVDLYLSYAQCDADCADGANWVGTMLVQIHGTTKYNLAIEPNGRPRMGVYTGSYAYDPFQTQKLLYLWCDSDCGTAGSWSFTDTGMSFGSGDGVDLALDAQNRPRMSFETSGQGLGFAWCDTGCQSKNAVWQSQKVESQASLADNYEVLPIHRCTVSTWFNGQRGSLALDSTGNPRIAYDAQHWWYGTEIVGGVPQPCNYQDVTVTRVSIINQP